MTIATATLKTMTCPRCNGSGHYNFNPRFGTVCFGCDGHMVVPFKAPRKMAPVTRKIAMTVSLEAKCSGDPVKLEAMYDSNPDQYARTLNYLGITVTELRCYAILWDSGIKEIPVSR